MKKQRETWNEYLANKNVRPKTYNITLRRRRSGEFVMVGFNSLMEHNKGADAEWVRVNSRALAKAISENGITAL